MYDRYYDPAQAESDQKDLIISQLKADLFELRQTEKDYQQLNATLIGLQTRYQQLLADKERQERDQKELQDLNLKQILNLKNECDAMKNETLAIEAEINQIHQDNDQLQNVIDQRNISINKKKAELNNAIEIGRNISADIRQLELQVLQTQDEKTKAIAEQDFLKKKGDDLQQTLRYQDKYIQDLQQKNVDLYAEAKQLNEENEKLRYEIQTKKTEIEQAQQHLKKQNDDIALQESMIKDTQRLIDQARQDANNLSRNQQAENLHNKELQNKCANAEAQLKKKEDEVAKEKEENQQLQKDHQELSSDNQLFNEEIDKHLQTIKELTIINENLQKEIETFVSEDDRIRQILNRRERMQNLIIQNESKVRESKSTVSHVQPTLPSFMSGQKKE